MGIRIIKAGMMTTVQDLGRTGYQSQGFSVAGVMDVRSFKIANLLLDNPENEAVLEFSLIGPTLEFTDGTLIAITGGDFQPTINGEPAPMYTAIDVQQRPHRKPGLHCIFQLSQDSGGNGKPLYQYEKLHRRV